MWKWIVGGCLGLVVVAALAIWFGYRQLKTYSAAGPATSTVIGAPSDRVFASLSDGDSLAQWRLESTRIVVPHHGPLVVGDTLTMLSAGGRAPRFMWVVTAVAPGTVIAFDAIDSTSHRTLFTRRDSVAAQGDSTKVVSTVGAFLLDSLRSGGKEPGPVGKGVMGMASTAMVAGLRFQATEELTRLKARIEGNPLPPR